jgi:hypothetical protein
MEGMYAFFLESSFLALLVWGERRLSPRAHWGAALALFVGTWLSGWFIVATNAFMQHPVGHKVLSDGSVVLESGAFSVRPACRSRGGQLAPPPGLRPGSSSPLTPPAARLPPPPPSPTP